MLSLLDLLVVFVVILIKPTAKTQFREREKNLYFVRISYL